MQETYISRNRSKYLQLEKKAQLCIGNKQNCKFYSNVNTTILNWGTTPSGNEYKTITHLRLLPSKSDIKKDGIPEFIKYMDRLEFLHIPFPFLFKLKEENIPENVNTLMITYEYKYEDFIKKNEIRDGHNRLLVKGVIATGEYDLSGLGSLLNMANFTFPRLEFLSTYIDKKGSVMNIIKTINTLEHIELTYVYNLDIFESLPSSIKAIAINNSDVDFPVNELKRIKNLEMVQLIGIRSEIDCETFLHIPNLLEIVIHNSKRIKNINALLNCKKLKSIEFVNCNGVFKKEKENFAKNDYERLNIDFS